MILPDRALELILSHATVLAAESVPLRDAVGRVLAETLRAGDDLPRFDNSAMDGFAVRVEDCAAAAPSHPVALKVRSIVRAGAVVDANLESGEAVAVMTGAPVPRGADAVVMREMTRGGSDGAVEVLKMPARGDNIRPRGEDVRMGQILLEPGCLIRPYEIALLAAQSVNRVRAIRRPTAAVLVTGDELIGELEPLAPGKIRNSNGPAVASALDRWGISCLDLGVTPDNPEGLEEKIRQAVSEVDVMIITGGVSVGDFDFTKAVLGKLGVREVFWKVAIKPGKPLFFGVLEGSGPAKMIFGLPGNPVSVLVCLEEFVRPALEKLQGLRPGHPSYHLRGRAMSDHPKSPDRQQFLFCRASSAEDGFTLDILRPQGSAMVGMAVQANALAVAPIGTQQIRQGDLLSFRWLK